MTKPLILISNDDGITAPGIRKLIHTIKHLGEIVVVAPDSPQSGMGHAITVGNTIKLSKTDLFPNIEAYQCSGTPADCVKLAKHYVLKHRTIDLIVSGINHGSNSSGQRIIFRNHERSHRRSNARTSRHRVLTL